MRTEFGQVASPTLEVFFTQIAAVDRFHHEFNIQGRVSGKFSKHLSTLRQLIPRVFAEALGGRDCRWHARLASALRTGDSVLSFNYDTLIDRALRSVGGKRWVPATGYGFAVADGADGWAPLPSPGPAVARPIKLLKPHGSLNWHVDPDRHAVSLVGEYATSTATSIVPPTWDKSDAAEWPWIDVWRAARKVLGSARMLVVVGYSVPATDQLSQALLRADVNKLSALVVVNPDGEARRRVVEVLSSGLDSKAAVIQLDTFAEFAAYLAPSAVEPAPFDSRKEIVRLRDRIGALLERVEELEGASQSVIEEFEDARRSRFGNLTDWLDDLRLDIEQLESRAERLDDTGQDLALEMQRIRGEVGDLDARLDSIVL